MRVLILDDDKSYGALVASACKKLGHLAQVRTLPTAAIDVLREENADVLLLDLEMPQCAGPDVALELRSEGFELPIAFCTGTCQNQELIDSASAIAKVLPRVWTHADLKGILDTLELEHRTQRRRRATEAEAEEATMTDGDSLLFAKGTLPVPKQNFANSIPTEEMPLVLPADAIRVDLAPDAPGAEATETSTFVSPSATIEDLPVQTEFSGDQTLDKAGMTEGAISPSVSMALGEWRRSLQRVHINCASWARVRRLCDDFNRGQRTILVHASQELVVGQDVIIAIALPDEMVVSVGGRVRDFEVSADQVQIFTIEMTDFGPQEIDFLLKRCDAQARPPQARYLPEADSRMDTAPRVPSARDSAELDIADYEGEARISWAKPSS